MQKITKHILMMLGLLLFMSSQSMGQSKWAPIMMDDMMVMVPYGQPSVKVAKDYYSPNATVTVNVQGELSGDRDWVGIYRKGTSTEWKNVIKWAWVKHTGNIVINSTESTSNHPMPAGEYEARLFFHNNYEMKASDSFVVRKAPISTVKATYNVNETVSVNVQMALSGVKDWVGIYPKNSTDWADVIAWAWVEKNGVVTLTLDQKPMPAGEYEIRLFYKNSLDKIEARYAFRVGGGTIEYGKPGPYIDQIHINDDTGYGKIYYIKDTPNLPTVAFVGGAASLEYEGLRKYVASWGYQVVVSKTSETSKYVVNELKNLLNYVHDNYKADISKLGMMGKSRNGGSTFHNMKELKKDGFAGSQKSACISLDGWFPFSMKQQDMHDFTTPVMFIQYGGADGIDKESGETDGYKFYQDPNINVTNFKELKHVNIIKSFIFIEADNTHGYDKGNLNEMPGKIELLKPIHQFLNYNLKNKPAGYQPKNQINEVKRITKESYRYKCDSNFTMYGYGDYNFCNPDKPTYK